MDLDSEEQVDPELWSIFIGLSGGELNLPTFQL